MEKFDVFGISGDKLVSVNDICDVFTNDDENYFAFTKKTYKHEDDEDGLNFEYKYAIEGCYCEGKIFYSLMLVPMPESLSSKKLQSVLDCSGVTKEECNVYDVVSYGCSINMGTTSTEGEEIDYNVIDAIANTIEVINSLRGFYLDKCQNRIGSTGWDYLDEYMNDKDSVQVALDRYNESKSK